LVFDRAMGVDEARHHLVLDDPGETGQPVRQR
jgi:hypothetical protein